MDSDVGGWLWLVIDVVFVAVLIAALIYGTVMWRTRRNGRALEQASEQATKTLYSTRGKRKTSARRSVIAPPDQ